MKRPRAKRGLSIPAVLWIKGKRWRVRVSRGLRKREGVYGWCVREDREIILDADQDRREMELSLIHEVLHACFPRRVVSARVEERIVDKLEVPLHRVIASLRKAA